MALQYTALVDHIARVFAEPVELNVRSLSSLLKLGFVLVDSFLALDHQHVHCICDTFDFDLAFFQLGAKTSNLHEQCVALGGCIFQTGFSFKGSELERLLHDKGLVQLSSQLDRHIHTLIACCSCCRSHSRAGGTSTARGPGWFTQDFGMDIGLLRCWRRRRCPMHKLLDFQDLAVVLCHTLRECSVRGKVVVDHVGKFPGQVAILHPLGHLLFRLIATVHRPPVRQKWWGGRTGLRQRLMGTTALHWVRLRHALFV